MSFYKLFVALDYTFWGRVSKKLLVLVKTVFEQDNQNKTIYRDDVKPEMLFTHNRVMANNVPNKIVCLRHFCSKCGVFLFILCQLLLFFCTFFENLCVKDWHKFN